MEPRFVLPLNSLVFPTMRVSERNSPRQASRQHWILQGPQSAWYQNQTPPWSGAETLQDLLFLQSELVNSLGVKVHVFEAIAIRLTCVIKDDGLTQTLPPPFPKDLKKSAG